MDTNVARIDKKVARFGTNCPRCESRSRQKGIKRVHIGYKRRQNGIKDVIKFDPNDSNLFTYLASLDSNVARLATNVARLDTRCRQSGYKCGQIG